MRLPSIARSLVRLTLAPKTSEVTEKIVQRDKYDAAPGVACANLLCGNGGAVAVAFARSREFSQRGS